MFANLNLSINIHINRAPQETRHNAVRQIQDVIYLSLKTKFIKKIDYGKETRKLLKLFIYY